MFYAIPYLAGQPTHAILADPDLDLLMEACRRMVDAHHELTIFLTDDLGMVIGVITASARN